MPFDAATAAKPIQPTTAFAEIVTESLPKRTIEDHKEAVLAEFRAESAAQARLLDTGKAFWTSRPIDLDRLSRFGAPRPIKRLAHRIAEDVPEARFVIHYFYADPILEVCLPDTKSHYLGIWDQREVIAMAKVVRESAPVVARRVLRRVWSRCHRIASRL